MLSGKFLDIIKESNQSYKNNILLIDFFFQTNIYYFIIILRIMY